MVQLASLVLSVFFCGNVYVGGAASEHCPSEALAGQEATTGDSMLMKTGHLTKSLDWSSATLEGFVPSGEPAVLGMGASPEQVVLLDATFGGLSVNHGNMLTAEVFRKWKAGSATRWLVCAKDSIFLKIVELVLEESDGKIVVKADFAKWKPMADMCSAQTANEVADSGNPTQVATSNTQGYGYGVVDLRYLPIQAPAPEPHPVAPAPAPAPAPEPTPEPTPAPTTTTTTVCADGGVNDAPVIRMWNGPKPMKMSCFNLGPKGPFGSQCRKGGVKRKCKLTCGRC